jgi:hypothetical protein
MAAKISKNLSDDQLLDLVQLQTLKYFWDFGHPVSGMARERSNQGFGYDPLETVTSGGTGFGIMAMIAGAERGFLKKEEVLDRLHKMADFLNGAEKFHGAFPHFMNGATGKAIPFGKYDDGADIVETAFLVAGLLAARQYFSGASPKEQALRDKINALWQGVEWDWFTQGQDKLYWHWSKTHDWRMNHEIRGWDECLIAYVLAASSPTHPISKAPYDKCWTQKSTFNNGRTYYGHKLPLGPEKGGPLFFSHYSFMGLDPRGLKDKNADYWQQNVQHTRINREHCVQNPHGHKGYGADCWGLTSSDSTNGYNAHSPANDTGVITPTAALSAMPYMPKESMAALRNFYENKGHKIWGKMGFKDAFNESAGWVAKSHLAIDQGPIVVMIENHRSALLWNLFMSAPEVKAGLAKLGFESPHLKQPAAAGPSAPKP